MRSIAQLTFGRYYPAASTIHGLDVRFKIVMIMLFSIVVLSLDTLTGFFAAAVMLGGLVTLSRVPLTWVVRSARPLMYIFVITLMIHTLFTGGDGFQLWILNISLGGFSKGLFVDLRLFLLICGSAILTLTSTPTELNLGFERLLMPLTKLRVPVPEIAFMMTISLSFIPLLIGESDKIMKAQMARGAKFSSGSLIERGRALVPLVIPLFIKVFKTANDLSYAMEARCYVPGEKRTRWRVLKARSADILTFALIVSFLVAVYVAGTWFGIYKVL